MGNALVLRGVLETALTVENTRDKITARNAYKDKKIMPGSGSVHRRRREETDGGTGLFMFRIRGSGAKEAYVSGTFSNWEQIPMLVRTEEDFMTVLELPEGEHQFRYLVDGSWTTDSDLPSVDNRLGSRNNVIFIRRDSIEFGKMDKEKGDPTVWRNKLERVVEEAPRRS